MFINKTFFCEKIFNSFFAAIAFPTAVNAETVWLVLRYGRWLNSVGGSTALEKIEMKDIAQCELMGAKWVASKLNPRETPRFTVLAFECLEGN